MRIAILDDDPAQLAHLVSIFQAPLAPRTEQVACETFTRGTALRNALRRETFDLLLLDWNVPDLDGVDLLRWLREEKEDFTPVLMLSSRAAERDVAAALALGADDYVVKPFRPLELRARLARLYARRPSRTEVDALNFDNWGFDSARSTVTYRGDTGATPTALTESEFRLALALFRNIGKPVSRSYLIEKAGYAVDNMSSRTLDSHIYRLRGKLKLDGERELALLTVYGVGYRLEANQPGAR
ncbi:MAG: response regulator transcription factor [Pseudomonadota bacterium]